MKYDNWSDTRQAILQVVKDEYKRHPELLMQNNSDPDDQRFLERLMNDALTDVELATSLYRLTQMLYVFHREKFTRRIGTKKRQSY